jgi:hypothetical protein
MNYVPDCCQKSMTALIRTEAAEAVNAAVLGCFVRLRSSIPALPDDKIPDLCRQACLLAPKVHKRGEQYPFQRVSAFKFLEHSLRKQPPAATLVAVPLDSALAKRSLINSVVVSF